jgi:hypothetical protein
VQIEPWQDDDEWGLEHNKGEHKATIDGQKDGLILEHVDHLHDKVDESANAKHKRTNVDGETAVALVNVQMFLLDIFPYGQL